jgi:outer membrane protein TolC
MAVLALAAARPLASQATADPLGAIVAEALRNNLGIAQERLATERADAGVREARGRFLPSLSLDSRYSEQRGTLNLGDVVNPAYAALNQVIGENRFPTDIDVTLPQTHESRLRLTQPLFNASISAGFALSRHARDAQRSQQGATARSLAAQAQTAYLNVATARSARRTWEATLELVMESERVATRLVEAGRATPDAVFRARADRSDVEQRLAEARDQEDAAARAFNQLLRRRLATPVDELPDSLRRFELRLTEDEAIARALAGREELAQTDAGIRAADAGVRLATASFMPNVALALDYGVQGQDVRFSRDNDFVVASVVVSWNLFNGGQDLARRQAAQADAHQRRLRRAELEDLVRLDVTRAYRAAVVARDAISTAEAGLAAARRNFELVRRRYEEGLANQVEFLDARTAFTNAELNRVITVYRYAMRYVDLERAAALRDVNY